AEMIHSSLWSRAYSLIEVFLTYASHGDWTYLLPCTSVLPRRRSTRPLGLPGLPRIRADVISTMTTVVCHGRPGPCGMGLCWVMIISSSQMLDALYIYL